MQAQRGSRAIVLLILNFGARRGVGSQRHALAALSLGNNPVPIVQYTELDNSRYNFMMVDIYNLLHKEQYMFRPFTLAIIRLRNERT